MIFDDSARIHDFPCTTARLHLATAQNLRGDPTGFSAELARAEAAAEEGGCSVVSAEVILEEIRGRSRQAAVDDGLRHLDAAVGASPGNAAAWRLRGASEVEAARLATNEKTRDAADRRALAAFARADGIAPGWKSTHGEQTLHAEELVGDIS